MMFDKIQHIGYLVHGLDNVAEAVAWYVDKFDGVHVGGGPSRWGGRNAFVNFGQRDTLRGRAAASGVRLLRALCDTPRLSEGLMDEREDLLERLLGSRGAEILGQKSFALPLKQRQVDLATGLAVLPAELVEVRAGMRRLVSA
jgi:hypothetical protein